MTFESKRVFELHIFKDLDKTNWTKPSVHTFPLSTDSFPRFNRADPYPENSSRFYRRGRNSPAFPFTSRDGLLNLWRCGPEQLGFLQKHIDERNAEVKKRHKKMLEEHLRSKEEDKYEEEKEKEKFEENLKKDQENYQKTLDAYASRLNHRAQSRDSSRSRPRSRSREGISVPSNEAEGRRHRSRERRYRRSPPQALSAIPASFPPDTTQFIPHGFVTDFPQPPPPFPIPQPPSPVFHPRPTRVDPTIYETLWSLESVELDLEPYEVVFQKEERNIYTPIYKGDGTADGSSKKSKKPWEQGSLKVSSYKLSEAGKYEFAIVLSRHVCIKSKPQDYRQGSTDIRYNRHRHRSISPDGYGPRSHCGPISPEASIYGEAVEDREQLHSDEDEEGEDKDNNYDNDNNEEYDYDMEVISCPNETGSAVPGV